MLQKVSIGRQGCAPCANVENVRRHFLLPRLVRDELALVKRLV